MTASTMKEEKGENFRFGKGQKEIGIFRSPDTGF